MNDDLSELLSCLRSYEVEFLVIGAHAVGFYSRPRMTDDLNLWVGRSPTNAERLGASLAAFGIPIGTDGVMRFRGDPRQMIRLGAPPHIIDMLNIAADLDFPPVYARRVLGRAGGVEVSFPSLEDLVKMKRCVGRPQDQADITGLEKADGVAPSD